MAARTVLLPSNFNASVMYEFLRQIIGADNKPLSAEICLGFDRLAFIQAEGITILSNVINWLSKRDVKLSFSGYQGRGDAIRYLDDCGFFETFFGQPLRPMAAVRDTTFPIQQIPHSKSHAWLGLEAIPWLAGILAMSEASLADLKTSLMEIFNNIDDHSEEEIGCIHFQWFPNRNRVMIAISDFGIGIPSTIRTQYPQVTNDGHAIEHSTINGVSSKPNGRNQGAGMGILIDNVVGRNRGAVNIYSHRGGFVQDPHRRRSWQVPNAFYPGTLIKITLRTDTIERIEQEREDFRW